jgi:hypothetical protein
MTGTAAYVTKTGRPFVPAVDVEARRCRPESGPPRPVVSVRLLSPKKRPKLNYGWVRDYCFVDIYV